ncbi:MAG: DMT family transporter [Saprospiraceae bacterium]|nr:DMT family transporter [Candidatus Vicinibacter proximus]MBL7822302.1 DMT family transporter [Saprospiraceae bacterium]MCC6843054.1 DMT family transporter [Saprospiraceae bacterium]HRG31952.1 DMT family transporter [Saprospiraceae bacterium]
MVSEKKSYFYVHFAVFLFGFTGILGQLIELPAITLVWWRALLTWLLLIPYMLYNGAFRQFNKGNFIIFGRIGILVALHWICFYGSIKLANASVAMICLATIPVLTAFFEAWTSRKAIMWKDALIGLLTIPGILMINQSIPDNFRLGFFVGLLAAALSALFASYNKKHITKADPILITWIELLSVWLFISFILPGFYWFKPENTFLPSSSDWFYLFILSLFCTVFAYVLALKAMKFLSAFSVMLAFNMETVYGIILSIVFLQEHKQLNGLFYVGVMIIMGSLFIDPIIKKSKAVSSSK